jgi:hypothetical protein
MGGRRNMHLRLIEEGKDLAVELGREYLRDAEKVFERSAEKSKEENQMKEAKTE